MDKNKEMSSLFEKILETMDAEGVGLPIAPDELRKALRELDNDDSYKRFLESVARIRKPVIDPIAPPNYSYELSSA